MRSVTLRSITATSLALAMVVMAQQAPPPAAKKGAPAPAAKGNTQAPVANPKGPVTFTSNTQLVIEDVILKDKTGQPISDLTAKDFVVMEEGKLQEVKICEFQKLEEQAAAPITDEPQTKTETIKTEVKKDDPPKVTSTQIA